tara:strand:+ start:336 stop:512 length:177 start_codon:yes stop_codon:yes gene_type:complete
MLWDAFLGIGLFATWGILYACAKKLDALQKDVDTFGNFVRIMRFNEIQRDEDARSKKK